MLHCATSSLSADRVAARLLLSVQPGAKRDEIVGWQGDRLRVKVAAPPVEGAANRALVKFLAKSLGVKRSQIELVRGEKSREKTFELDGLRQDELKERITALLRG